MASAVIGVLNCILWVVLSDNRNRQSKNWFESRRIANGWTQSVCYYKAWPPLTKGRAWDSRLYMGYTGSGTLRIEWTDIGGTTESELGLRQPIFDGQKCARDSLVSGNAKSVLSFPYEWAIAFSKHLPNSFAFLRETPSNVRRGTSANAP